jgi:addiction module HigA family antidote
MPRLRTHPGEVLREEYLLPLGLSARALAKALDVPANRMSEIVRGTRDVSVDTVIRLGRYFGTDPRFWLNLQAAHNLSKADAASCALYLANTRPGGIGSPSGPTTRLCDLLVRWTRDR